MRWQNIFLLKMFNKVEHSYRKKVRKIDAIKDYIEVQKIIDITSVMFLWVIGIICIPIMKKMNPLKYKPYAIYVMAICVIITIFAIQYLC